MTINLLEDQRRILKSLLEKELEGINNFYCNKNKPIFVKQEIELQEDILNQLETDFNIHHGKATNADMKVFRDNAKPNDILENYDGRTYIVIEPKGNDVDETVFMKELTINDNDVYLHVKR